FLWDSFMLEMKKAEASFIAELVPAAQEAQRRYGIRASILIAQAIRESAWKKTRLAREDFNYFGIPAIPNADYREFAVDDYLNGKKELMLRYAQWVSPAGGMRSHAYLLASMVRYAPAMCHVESVLPFAMALQECGYSSDPDYADRLVG